MKIRTLYLPEEDRVIQVERVAKHSNKMCLCLERAHVHGIAQIETFVHVVSASELEVPSAYRPHPPRVPFTDPMEIMKRGTKLVYSAMFPSLRKDGEATSHRVRQPNE